MGKLNTFFRIAIPLAGGIAIGLLTRDTQYSSPRVNFNPPVSATVSKYEDGHSEVRVVAMSGRTNILYSTPGIEGSFETLEAIKQRELDRVNSDRAYKKLRFDQATYEAKEKVNSISPTNWSYFTGRFSTNSMQGGPR